MANPYAASIPLLTLAPQSSPLALPDFLSEVSHFTTKLDTFTEAVHYTSMLHDAALHSATTGESHPASGSLESAIADSSAQAQALKDFLKAMERDMLLTERDGDFGDARTKRGQCETAKLKLRAAMREFEKTERTYRTRYNELLARQYRIVNPSASDAEIEAAVSSGETQVFSQALLQGNRSASANSVARAVRERQQDIARIERTLEELVLLFEQLEEQVLLAEPMVEAIQNATDRVTDDVGGAVTHLSTGVKTARATRRKKWWMLLIVILILVAIAIIIAVVVVVNNNKKN